MAIDPTLLVLNSDGNARTNNAASVPLLLRSPCMGTAAFCTSKYSRLVVVAAAKIAVAFRSGAVLDPPKTISPKFQKFQPNFVKVSSPDFVHFENPPKFRWFRPPTDFFFRNEIKFTEWIWISLAWTLARVATHGAVYQTREALISYFLQHPTVKQRHVGNLVGSMASVNTNESERRMHMDSNPLVPVARRVRT